MASELHKAFVLKAAEAGLVRFVDAAITLKAKASPTGKDEKVPFRAAEFLLSSREDAARLYDLAEETKGTVKDESGKEIPADNPVPILIEYAYGLNCRAKVRAQFEAKNEDPEKADKKMAETLVKNGRFKSFEKALAAVKLMHEDDEE